MQQFPKLFYLKSIAHRLRIKIQRAKLPALPSNWSFERIDHHFKGKVIKDAKKGAMKEGKQTNIRHEVGHTHCLIPFKTQNKLKLFSEETRGKVGEDKLTSLYMSPAYGFL